MVAATDTHDRGKSFSTGRGGQLAKVAKKGRHDMLDHLGLLMIFPMGSESDAQFAPHVSRNRAAYSRLPATNWGPSSVTLQRALTTCRGALLRPWDK